MTMDSLTDAKNYSGADSGCEQATDYIGYQSSCLSCPFEKCLLDEARVGISKFKKRTRNEEIIQRFKKGESIEDLALAFSICERTIQRLLKLG